MAVIRKSEIQNMSVEQMEEKLKELRKELMKLNAQISMGTTPESPGKLRAIKKTISRLIFLINNKHLEVSKKQ
jgi:large subunit ribosomal protein L29